MRVTQNMISNNMLRNLSNSYKELDKYMNQLNTGKKINKPSDDPVIAMKGMGYRSEVRQVEQFKRNTNEVHNWFDNSDAALDKATQALQRIRELTVQASNDTNDDSERNSIKEEVGQLKEHLIEIANTQVNGKYIFNGTNTEEKPITKSGDEWDIPFDNDYEFNPVQIEVSKGTILDVNVNPLEVFATIEKTPDTGEDEVIGNVFDTIDNLIGALDGEEESEDLNSFLGKLDDHINNVIDTRADLGARMNRLELIENRLNEQEVIAKQTMSNNEDVDYAKAITELITQESLHRAALSSGSRIIQPTLLDFLR